MAIKTDHKHPKKKHHQLPYPDQKQDYPGIESDMQPRPEYGREIYKGHNRLKGKTAIITGGDSGIGRATAVAFAKEGAHVAVSYLSEDSDAEETKSAIEEAGQKCITIPGDIQDKSHCESIVTQTVKDFGTIDILVNNAAYQMHHESISEYTPDELDRFWRTNISAMIYLCQAALPHMLPGSSVINTSSIQAFKPSPTLLAYAITKAAIVNFTRSFSQEAIHKGIRVNSVAPGPVWTPLIPSTVTDAQSTSQFGSGSVFERPAQPIELATLFVFLASDDASYVTGQTYGATGALMP